MARKEKENKIQQDAVIWFNNTYCLKTNSPRYIILSIPNEGEDAYEIKRKKDRGMLSGASDLLIILNKLTVFAETKTPEGRQSPAQEDFQIRVTELGHIYFIFRSLDEFKRIMIYIIDKYGKEQ